MIPDSAEGDGGGSAWRSRRSTKGERCASWAFSDRSSVVTFTVRTQAIHVIEYAGCP